MIGTDERAFICDMAETYHILDWRSYDLKLIATLGAGLSINSRINLKLSNQKYDLNTLLMAKLTDLVAWLQWAQTEDARDGLNRPVSIMQKLFSKPEENKKEYRTFDSTEEFDQWRKGWIQNGKD